MTSIVLHFPRRHSVRVPRRLQQVEERFSEALVDHFVRRFTKPGDVVFDPFLGLGTSMIVAERLKRCAYGCERNAARVSFVRTIVAHPERVLHKSALDITRRDLPPVDFCISSPPYSHSAHSNNPLKARGSPQGSYKEFLADLTLAYARALECLKPGGFCVIEVSNLMDAQSGFCPLAWDIARRVADRIPLRQTIIGKTDEEQYGFSYTYCFVFEKIARNTRR